MPEFESTFPCPASSPGDSRPCGWLKIALVSLGLSIAIGAIYVLPVMMARPLTETPEARVAVVAREMLTSGEWVLPTLGGEVRLNKPPWAYWQTAAAAWALKGDGPADETVMTRAVLLPSAFAATLTVAVLVLFAGLCWGCEAGVTAGLCFGLSWLTIRYSQMGFLDCSLMAACAVSLCGAAWLATAPRPGVGSAMVFGVGLGIGVLTKGPLALVMVLPPLVVGALLEWSLKWRRLFLVLLGLSLAALVAVPWFMMVAQRLPEGLSVSAFLSREMGDGHHQDDRFIYYIYKLAGGFLPWTLIGLLALVAAFSRRGQRVGDWMNRRLAGSRLALQTPEPYAAFRFFVLAAALGFLILYSSAKQQEHYLLPVMPSLALAVACLLAALCKPGGRREERLAWMQWSLGPILGLAVATAPVWCAPCRRMGLGYLFCIPAGFAVAALNVYAARQWAEGRPARAIGALALLVWIAGVAHSVLWTWRVQEKDALAREAPRIRSALEAAGPGVHVYGAGMPLPLLVFYFERPVGSLENLTQEASGDGPERQMLIARRKDILNPADPLLRALNLASRLDNGTSELVLLQLPRDGPDERE